MIKRLALAVLIPISVILVIAGAHTLLTGRSLRALFEPPPAALQVHFDEERSAAAARNVGDYRVHIDPRVGYTFRTKSELTTVGAAFRTDDLGLRVRVGPPGAPDARHVVILGDSVAFGMGLTDAQCLAQQLEDALAAARGDDGPRTVVCHTVAVCGWNWRNAIAFLQDHFDRFQPSIVLFMPVANDLTDGEGVYETGHRRMLADPVSDDPLLFVSLGRTDLNLLALWPRVKKGLLALSDADLGADALNGDLGGLSARRYDAMAAGIADLSHELAARSIRFALLEYNAGSFHHALQRRLALRGDAPRWIPLLQSVRPEDTLESDPHPNATTAQAMALWTARALLGELAWIEPGAGHPLPPLPAGYADRQARILQGDEIARMAAADRAGAAARLIDAIEPARGRGARQIYGGLSPAQTIGPRLLLALPRRSGVLELEIAPLASRGDLLPLDIEVDVDGAPIGTLTLRAEHVGKSLRSRFPVTPGLDRRADGAAAETMDIHLVPRRFVAIEELGGIELASAKLLRAAVRSE